MWREAIQIVSFPVTLSLIKFFIFWNCEHFAFIFERKKSIQILSLLFAYCCYDENIYVYCNLASLFDKNHQLIYIKFENKLLGKIV